MKMFPAIALAMLFSSISLAAQSAPATDSKPAEGEKKHAMCKRDKDGKMSGKDCCKKRQCKREKKEAEKKEAEKKS